MKRRVASDDPSRHDAAAGMARALGGVTRHAIYRHLADAGRPCGVAELTDRFGIHHNAVRQHLAKLRDAGLIVETTNPPTGRGRPTLSYRIVPGAAGHWDGPSPHERLATLLLELLETGGTPYDVGFGAGRRMAIEHGTELDAVDVLEIVAMRLGFEPVRSERADGADIVLDCCPFGAMADASPGVVCELHRGMAAGIADTAAGAVSLRGFVVTSGRDGGCRLELARAG